MDAAGKLPPLSQAFIDKHKDGVGPYMAAGLPAFLQGQAAVFIYAAGLRKAGSPETAMSRCGAKLASRS